MIAVRFLRGIVTSACFLLLAQMSIAKAPDRKEFYRVFAEGSPREISELIKKLDESPGTVNNAFKGTLLMRKAAFLKTPGQKLNSFKQGVKLLEQEIEKNPENAEFRFLRLSIQEHAPKILRYNKDIDEDKKVIVAGYGQLDPEVKSEIKKYSKKSGLLKIGEAD